MPILPCNVFPASQERSKRCVVRHQQIDRDKIGAVDIDHPLDVEAPSGNRHGRPRRPKPERGQLLNGPRQVLPRHEQVHGLSRARGSIDGYREAADEGVGDPGRVESLDDPASSTWRSSATGRIDLADQGQILHYDVAIGLAYPSGDIFSNPPSPRQRRGMAPPLRLEFPGARYHVTARGNGRQLIFMDDADRERFLTVLASTVGRYHVLCHAYCLLGNHYHLLQETSKGNLSRARRQLNGVYGQGFSRRHRSPGHVLQGRFHAQVVDRDAYLREVSQYIILNPVRPALSSIRDSGPGVPIAPPQARHRCRRG